MGDLPIDWDPEKAAENISRHQGVTFEEGSTVFQDPLSKTFLDPQHSEGEGRYLEVGYSNRGRLLIVSYTERQGRIRIINARRVTRKERRLYEAGERPAPRIRG